MTGFFMWARLTIAALLSSLALCLVTFAASAHEVSPSIGDFTTGDGQLVLELRINLEAFVAGIDLDGVADTNETAQSGDYDSLRALAPEVLEARTQAIWPDIRNGFRLRAGGTEVPLELTGIKVDAIGDIDFPRPSFLTLTADQIGRAACRERV